MLQIGATYFLNRARLMFEAAVFCRRKAMKGRLYFATKAQKEGKILIKTHPCAQIFCCDICGFEKVLCFINIIGISDCIAVMHRKYVTTGWHCNLKVGSNNLSFYCTSGNLTESERCSENMCSNFSSAGGCRTILQRVRRKTDRRV